MLVGMSVVDSTDGEAGVLILDGIISLLQN